MSGILTINAGSSSLKFAVFGAQALERRLWGQIDAIGGDAALTLSGGGETIRAPIAAPDHHAALSAMLAALAQRGVAPQSLLGAGHRVVHGGPEFDAPAAASAEAIAAIERYAALAPLHNPHNLAGIRAIAALAPGLPQTVSFDTAFHAGQPREATEFALPERIRAMGVRRYGFHGLSYQGLTQALPKLAGGLPRRVLAAHLGNGASLCAIVDGRSVATTMGFTATDGLPMGARSGSLDPGALMYLMRAGMDVDGVERMLNRESGLLGLSGLSSDMRVLLASPSEGARFALRYYAYWVARHAGAMIAAMEGVDAVAFTGGVGENAAPIRAAVMAHLAWAGLTADLQANAEGGPRISAAGSQVSAWIVPADEEAVIARDCAAILGLQAAAQA